MSWRRHVGTLGGIPALLATGYCAWNYAGPFAWIAELQLLLIGHYSVNLTAVTTVLVFVLVFVIPIRYALGWEETQPDLENDWVMRNPRSAILVIGGPICLCVAAYSAFDASTIGELTPTSIALVEQGDSPARHVHVEGILVPDAAVSLDNKFYVPLSSTGRPPFAVFAELTTDTLPALPMDGVLYEDGLPGQVRNAFASEGLLAERHWRLGPERMASFPADVAKGFGAVGVLMLVAFGVTRAWIAYRARRVSL